MFKSFAGLPLPTTGWLISRLGKSLSPPPPKMSSFFFSLLGFELRAHIMSHFFVMAFFEIGSDELFVRAGFEPQSS
jgi:hypothetical protein